MSIGVRPNYRIWMTFVSMAALMNTYKLLQKLQATNPALCRQALRAYAGWNKDFKPGPFPKTQAEREAAAKKYNLMPEEYRPYADDGYGYGDYPKLEGGLGDEAKDPFYPYDFPEMKRNFNEVLHVDADLYSENCLSMPGPPRYSHNTYWLGFLASMAVSFGLFYWLEDYKMYRPVAAKQYPDDGHKHYTFETEIHDIRTKVTNY